jgi:hypothetical protein
MVRKSFLLGILFLFVFLASGCTVAKSAGGACAGFAQGAAVGATEGFKDDVSWIKKADNWVKENLW